MGMPSQVRRRRVQGGYHAGGPSLAVPLAGELGDFAFTDPVFSADGRRLLVVELAGSGATTSRIWSVSLDGESAFRLTDGDHFHCQPVLLPDGFRLFFLSDRGGALDIWQLDLDRRGRPCGSPRALSTGIGIGSFAAAPRGDGVVYNSIEERSSIRRAPLESVREGRVHEASRFFIPFARDPEGDALYAWGRPGESRRRVSDGYGAPTERRHPCPVCR